MGPMKFEWDPVKAIRNAAKHGISFEEASMLFLGREDFVEIYDDRQSEDEDRFIAIGLIDKGVVVIVYVQKTADVIRIISARKATKAEILMFTEFKRTRGK